MIYTLTVFWGVFPSIFGGTLIGVPLLLILKLKRNNNLREVGSTLPDNTSREGVWGRSAGLVSGGRSGVGAHVDRYFFSGIRLLGPSFLAPGMRIVIGFHTFRGSP